MKRGHVSRTFVEAVAEWQKTRGLTADGIIGEKTWSAMKPSISSVTAREEPEIEYQLGSKPKRLSAGAVGDAFLEYRQSVSVPDTVIDVLHRVPSFRLMVNSMDKKYVAATTLAKSGEPADMDDGGFLTRGRFAGRRVLEIVSVISSNAFLAARTVDNLDHTDRIQLAEPNPDPSPDPAFKERMLHRHWIARILCLLAQAENEVRAKRKRADPIATRIKARVTEQRIIRLNIDNMLQDIDRNNKGFNIGTLFADFRLQPFVEIAYYPDDLIVMESPRTLTNLEHCALLELLEDARRAEKLADASVEEQKRLIDAIALSTDVTDLARTLEAPWPTVIDDKTGRERIIPTDFGAYYHARRIFDRRWQQVKPRGK
ncbi:MAG: peptidoglycan-binding domain-containing protein, partial [Vicinamibacterales bacterium]